MNYDYSSVLSIFAVAATLAITSYGFQVGLQVDATVSASAD